MNEEEIIASGLLELYVMGATTQDEKELIENTLLQSPMIIKEIEIIEATLMHLSETVGKDRSPAVWERIRNQITPTRTLPSKKTNWTALTGWAAAILCFAGLFWMLKKNNDLQEKVRYTTVQNEVLEDELKNQEMVLSETTSVLDVVRSKEYQAVNLPGNVAVSPNSYATVYYNSTTNTAYIDAKGLPTPPEGKVYQVWSLIMDPLTPSSIGVLDSFNTTENKFFRVENVPTPEAFGITLEPAGGSESPTLEQLYTLGMVAP